MAQHLCRRNLCVLPSYPEKQRQQIVQMMIARGRKWGATWESSLCFYGDLMQTVAPNFDQHAEIRAVLESTDETADFRIKNLNTLVRRTVWREAESKRIELYLYTHPDLDTESHATRVNAALPVVLWEKANRENAAEIANASFQSAKRLKISDHEDAILVTAVADHLYGPELMDSEKSPWINDVLDLARPLNVRVEMLRLRMALDFGRRV